MNQNFEYSPGNLYALRAGNCTSVPDGGIIFHDEVVIGEIPLDTGNDNLLTIDGLNRIHQLPITDLQTNPFNQQLNTYNDVMFNKITSGIMDVSNITSTTNTTMDKNTEFDNGFVINSGTVDFTNATDIIGIDTGNPFDQDLNTTDEVMFEKICIKPSNFDPNVDSDICINSPNIASFNLDTGGGLYPTFTLTDRGALNGDGTSIGFGFYRDINTGAARSSGTQWVTIERNHNSKLLRIAGSGAPQIAGEFVTDVTFIADFSVDEVIIQRPLKLNSIPFQTVLIAQNILTLNNLNIVEKSNAVIDTFGNYTSSGIMTVETPTLAPELISEFVLIKEGNNQIKKVALDELYGQPLNSLADVTFNNIFSNGLVQTDQVLESTLNNGVDITSWNIKTQRITSDALVNVNDPLSINMKYFGDNEIPLSLSAIDHDDISINMDCHRVINSPDTYISGSVLGNFILDKSDDSFNILAQNGISKGSGFLKSGMQKVAQFFKTSISLNETVNFLSAIVAPNLTTDPENADTYFLTQNKSTNEILKRDFQPAYGTISGQGNILETVINTIDIYVPLIGFIGSSDPLRNITIPPLGDTLQITNSGLYEIHYNISVQPANLAATKLWESAVFVNGIQTITSSIMCCQTTDSDELTEISNSFMYDGTAGDVFDLRIRNRTNTVNVIMKCATLTIKRLIN